MAEDKYEVDPRVEELAQRLVEKYKLWDSFPKKPNVIYLLRKGPWRVGDREKLGECSRATGKWKFLTNVDFVIVLNKDFWTSFPESREPLLLHELLHIGGKMTTYAGKEEWKWQIVPHDIEEFVTVVKDYGAWNAELTQFVASLKDEETENNK